jgi:hypothetical protein
VLSIVCWRWTPLAGYRSSYGPETVNTLRRMVARHYRDPHRFICVTDDGRGLDGDIEVVPLWNDFSDMTHPQNPMYPSCYRRLRAFAPDIAKVFGERFVSVDLDTVIVDDMRPVWNRPEAFVGFKTLRRTHYNGSMFLLTAGARQRVWDEFNPKYSPKWAQDAGHYGSDQAWMSFILGGKEARWTDADGVYSYRESLAQNAGALPSNARIVVFNGKLDPWSPEVAHLDWIKEHYR